MPTNAPLHAQPKFSTDTTPNSSNSVQTLLHRKTLTPSTCVDASPSSTNSSSARHSPHETRYIIGVESNDRQAAFLFPEINYSQPQKTLRNAAEIENEIRAFNRNINLDIKYDNNPTALSKAENSLTKSEINFPTQKRGFTGILPEISDEVLDALIRHRRPALYITSRKD